MSTNKYTNIEKQMRSSLGENLLQEDWNTPDDALFFSALEQIDEQKNEVGVGGSLYLSGILIFSLLLLLIGHSTINFDKQQLSVVDNSNNSEILESKSIANTVNKGVLEELVVKEDVIQVQAQSQLENEIINENNSKLNEYESIDLDKPALIVEKQNVTSIIYSNDIYNSYENSVKELSSTVSNNDPKEAELIEISNDLILDSKVNSTLNDNQRLVNHSSILSNNEIEKFSFSRLLSNTGEVKSIENSRYNFSISLNTGINYNSFSMPNVNSPEVKGYTDWQQGTFVNLGIQQKISKRFNVTYDLGYSKVSNSSRYLSEMIYDSANEVIDIFGNLVYNCEIEVNSPTTNFMCDMNLKLNHDMDDNEKMTSVTDIIQNYEVLRLGVAPTYDVYVRNRWNISIGASLSANYITKFEQSMDFKLFHDSYIMTRETMVDNDVSKLNRFFISAGAISAIDYQWTDRFNLGIQASYGRSLTSLNTAQPTYLRDVRLGIKGSWRF